MSGETTEQQTTDDSERLSIGGKIVVVLCVVGVIVALLVALDASDIALFDGHAAEVLSDAWNRTATIGLIVAVVITAAVGVFVVALARATLLSNEDPDPFTEH
ncbi:MAG: hypothetical protein ACR2N2_03580 [Acidimicrobiia bacterium]